MRLIVLYLLLVLALILSGAILYAQAVLPDWLQRQHFLPFLCTLCGGVGGVIYCLRGVYLNACVLKQWDDEWKPWYYIRPIVSILCGGVSFIFLKAGLLVLGAKHSSDSNMLGFLALAFIAGYNGDNFLNKLEGIAQATWGIEKSRTAKQDGKKEDR